MLQIWHCIRVCLTFHRVRIRRTSRRPSRPTPAVDIRAHAILSAIPPQGNRTPSFAATSRPPPPGQSPVRAGRKPARAIIPRPITLSKPIPETSPSRISCCAKEVRYGSRDRSASAGLPPGSPAIGTTKPQILNSSSTDFPDRHREKHLTPSRLPGKSGFTNPGTSQRLFAAKYASHARRGLRRKSGKKAMEKEVPDNALSPAEHPPGGGIVPLAVTLRRDVLPP